MPQDRAAAWARLAPALQQADVAADRYYQLVTQTATHALQQRAQRLGRASAGDPAHVRTFAARVAQSALQQAVRSPGPRPSAPSGMAGLIGGIMRGLAQQDREAAQRARAVHPPDRHEEYER